MPTFKQFLAETVSDEDFIQQVSYYEDVIDTIAKGERFQNTEKGLVYHGSLTINNVSDLRYQIITVANTYYAYDCSFDPNMIPAEVYGIFSWCNGVLPIVDNLMASDIEIEHVISFTGFGKNVVLTKDSGDLGDITLVKTGITNLTTIPETCRSLHLISNSKIESFKTDKILKLDKFYATLNGYNSFKNFHKYVDARYFHLDADEGIDPINLLDLVKMPSLFKVSIAPFSKYSDLNRIMTVFVQQYESIEDRKENIFSLIDELTDGLYERLI